MVFSNGGSGFPSISKGASVMWAKIFNFLAIVFYSMAALLWVVLGLTSPGGVDRAGQPLDPELYYQLGSVLYTIVGSFFLIPVGIVAGIGAIFSAISNSLKK